MREKKHTEANIEIFFDLLAKAGEDQELAEALNSHTVVLLPEDNPDLSASNFANARILPSSHVIFLGASKSEGAKRYDRFVIKESPIIL